MGCGSSTASTTTKQDVPLPAELRDSQVPEAPAEEIAPPEKTIEEKVRKDKMSYACLIPCLIYEHSPSFSFIMIN